MWWLIDLLYCILDIRRFVQYVRCDSHETTTVATSDGCLLYSSRFCYSIAIHLLYENLSESSSGMVLFIKLYYFHWLHFERLPDDDSPNQLLNDNDAYPESTTANVVIPCVLVASFFAGAVCITNNDSSSSFDSSYSQPNRRLLGFYDGNDELSESIFTGPYDRLGYVIGSIACAAYFCGRLPQIYQNYRRKTLQVYTLLVIYLILILKGLSRFMFVIIWVANLTYGASVLMGGSGGIYLIRHLPWLLGSLGLCLFDVIIFSQYIVYGSASPRHGALTTLVDDGDDDSLGDDAPLIRPGTIIWTSYGMITVFNWLCNTGSICIIWQIVY